MITERQSDLINPVSVNMTQKASVKKNSAEQQAIDFIAEEQQYRSSVYKMLAGLMRTAPDKNTLDNISVFASIEQQQDELVLAMSMLGVSATAIDVAAVDDEFHALFIGLGRGELMPYASWYLTGFLMERPLSTLRDELAVLGFERSDNVHEPEDHIAALCEVMAMMIDEGFSINQQEKFFSAHIASWQECFYTDLSEAESSVFYRSVGRFGQAFSAFEKKYLAMPV